MWDFVLSITTIILSIVAIGINVRQNRNSKRQNLFDRRLRLYLELLDFWKLYENNIHFLNQLSPISIEIEFSYITNSSNFYMLADIMKNPLDTTTKTMFLTSCEKIKKDAIELKLVFGKKYVKCANFMEDYVEMLQQFHRQQVFIKSLDNPNQQIIHKNQPSELDDIKRKVMEFAQKEDGLLPSIQKIRESYEEIKKRNLLEKMEKEIALFKKIIAMIRLFCKYSIAIFIIGFFKRYWHWCG